MQKGRTVCLGFFLSFDEGEEEGHKENVTSGEGKLVSGHGLRFLAGNVYVLGTI